MRVAEKVVAVLIVVFAGAALFFAYLAVQSPGGTGRGPFAGTGAEHAALVALATGFAGASGVGGLIFGILHSVGHQPE